MYETTQGNFKFRFKKPEDFKFKKKNLKEDSNMELPLENRERNNVPRNHKIQRIILQDNWIFFHVTLKNFFVAVSLFLFKCPFYEQIMNF
jgi:hypothetical protein